VIRDRHCLHRFVKEPVTRCSDCSRIAHDPRGDADIEGMRRGENAVYTGVVWTPILLVLVALAAALYGGLGQLEATTNGTSYVVQNGTTMGTPLQRP
jgi:hypothetical protein